MFICPLLGCDVDFGCSRIEYTPDDDENLCQYLAARVPDEGAGGRQSLRIYEDLVNQVRCPIYILLIAAY